jgi:cytochrome oxidase Cu insertion factor (SCO1/SenC/PrrC family)
MGGMIATARLGAAIGVLALLALGCGEPQAERASRSGGSTRADASQERTKDGASADFTVTTFSGEEFTLSAQLGSPVVLNFFESW